MGFNHPHVANPRLQLENPEAMVGRVFEPPWEEMVAAHLRSNLPIFVSSFSQNHVREVSKL